MPRGYEKYDWVLGLWIVFLGAMFGLMVWYGKLQNINPLDRLHSLMMHLAFFGLAPGIGAALPYAASRAIAKLLIESQGIRTILTADGDSDEQSEETLP